MHSVESVCKLKNAEEIADIVVEEMNEVSLPKADFFIVTGTDLNSKIFPQIKLIKGH